MSYELPMLCYALNLRSKSYAMLCYTDRINMGFYILFMTMIANMR